MSEGTGPNVRGPAKSRPLQGRPDTTTGRVDSSLSSHSGQGFDTSIPGGTQTGIQAGMGMAPATLQGPRKETMLFIILALATEKPKKLHFHLKWLNISTKLGEQRKKAMLMLVDGIEPNFNMETQNRLTPLYAAAEAAGHQEICHMLIQAMCDEEQPRALMEACQNLLDARCNLQAATIPLHISAPEERLGWAMLFFLSGGLDVGLKNRVLETPPDSTACWAVLQANRRERESKYLRSPENAERLLHRDIARGQERVPVPCVNSVDSDSCPDDYEYIPECCVVTSPIDIDRDITHLQHCVCEEDCSATICLYDEEISLRCWYDEGGRLLPEFYLEDPPFVFECNHACSCARGCKNRVVQHGLRTRLQLFKTNTKGWGVRALEDIPQWTFVCQYAGEILSETEALMREDDTYILSLDCHGDQLEESYCVDSLFYGNISRFFNHLCEPNLFPCRVFTSHQDLRFPHIAFFTCSDVKAGEELGFDYGDAYWQDKGRYFSCECGSPKCKHSASAMMTQLQADNSPEE